MGPRRGAARPQRHVERRAGRRRGRRATSPASPTTAARCSATASARRPGRAAPTVAELDAVSGGRAVVLVSGDGHAGWLSSRALERLGLGPRTGPVEEAEWFEAFARLGELGPEAGAETALEQAVRAAAALGVVGVTDVEWERGPFVWPDRVRAGTDLLRVRTATYADGLDAVLSAGLRTGAPLEGADGLVTMGPLKVIFDGSLNTRTAWCCAPYSGTHLDAARSTCRPPS